MLASTSSARGTRDTRAPLPTPPQRTSSRHLPHYHTRSLVHQLRLKFREGLAHRLLLLRRALLPRALKRLPGLHGRALQRRLPFLLRLAPRRLDGGSEPPLGRALRLAARRLD